MLFAPKAPGRPRPTSGVSFLVETTPPRSVLRRDRGFRHALLAADLVAAMLVALAAARVSGRPFGADLLLLVLVPLVHAANGTYQRDERLINKSTLDEAPALFHVATVVAVLGLLVQSAVFGLPVHAGAVAITWIGLTALTGALRIAARATAQGLMAPERCLVVGDHDHGRRLAQRLVEAKVELAGMLALPEDGGALEAHQRLSAMVSDCNVHRVVIAADAGAPQQELHAIQAAKALGVKVSVVPRVLEVLGSSATYDYIDGLTLLGIPRFGLSRAAKLTKRTFDLVGSLLLIVLFLPVFAAIAVAIKLTSPGPVLFRQMRIGRHDEPFSMLKFRSMHDDADRLKEALRSRNESEGLFKLSDDPRVTSVGRVLRRSSLDELPQLWNVLRGEMSLVGPRPLIPEEDGMIQGWHRRRLQLTPGMTGPWQVLGSARIPLREMVTIDYQYVGNWSLWGDMKIMLRTLGLVLARGGR